MPDNKLNGAFCEGGEPSPGQCGRCRQRFYGEPRCNAFPDGIPLEILADKADHREPYPGDRGVRFTPLPPSEPDGSVHFAVIGAVEAPGRAGVVGAVWYCPTNDALGFVAADEQSDDAALWRERVYRGGEAAGRTGADLSAQVLDLCDGVLWDCTTPRVAADLFAVEAALARMVE